jgi:putative transposase
MLKAYKYRIYPTESQETNIENMFSMCRYLYNWSLKERIDAWEQEERNITYTEQQNKLPAMKKERPWFTSVYSQVLQDTLRRLDRAYQHFFRKAKDSTIKEKGFPKYKKKGQWNSITYPDADAFQILENGIIKVSKIGEIKVVFHRQVPENAKLKTLTITKEGDKWFACFSFEIKVHKKELKQDLSKSVGIDLGLIDFYYASDGDRAEVPKFFRKKQKQLEKLQRRLSKAEKRSKKYYKILKSLRKTHYRIKCQRWDFLHKKANHLLEKFDLIVHEKLNIRGMIRRPKPKQDENGKYLPNNASAKAGLNKSIADVGWYKFTEILKYKAIGLEKEILAVNPKMTSQKCSACGEIVQKSLSTRTHKCPYCGYEANRDHNAAINILRLGLESLGIQPQEAPTIVLA